MTHRQRTLDNVVEIRGVGLFSGREVFVRCVPAPEGSGVTFVRVDMPDAPAIPACITRLAPPGSSPLRATSLRQGDATVATIEHIMATVYGLGIDNLRVEVNGPEMPVGDGSAMTYVEPFRRAGLREQGAPAARFSPAAPLWVTEGDVFLALVPHENALTVTYVLDYGRKFLRSQALTIEMSEETFVKEIAPARTYCLRPEIEFFLSRGLGRGATEENTIVVEEDGSMPPGLRFPDECVRHKILDLLGDVALGARLATGRVVGYKSGHVTNVRLARMIRESLARSAQPVAR